MTSVRSLSAFAISLVCGAAVFAAEASAQSGNAGRAIVRPQAVDVVTVPSTRAGVTTRYVAQYNQTGVAIAGIAVVLLAGDRGQLKIDTSGTIGNLQNNFLIRMRGAFLSGGVTYVAAVDAPSSYATGVDGTARLSADYAADMAAVISEVKRRSGKPVWLVGTSNGTLSAVSLAIRLKGTPAAPAGIVLTSSRSTEVKGVCGISVFDVALNQIDVPVLVAGNPADGCQCTGYPQQKSIVTWLTGSPRKEFKSFTLLKNSVPPHVYKPLILSAAKRDPCTALTPHGFLGIEGQVVSYIVNWMGAGSRPILQRAK